MVPINDDIFREYDIRGMADADLTPEFVYVLGRAAARYFQESGETQVLV
ncbi:MAG TPA: phosphomannomutase, partial [Bacillota bacterium]|nr:phosphomannomutase [Bacillota bacterium]